MKHDRGSYNLGWIVGFFEGEAHFGTTSKSTKRKYYCRISVSQVRRQPLEFVMGIAGGHINGPRPNGNGKPIQGISNTSIQLVRTCLVLNWNQDKIAGNNNSR